MSASIQGVRHVATVPAFAPPVPGQRRPRSRPPPPRFAPVASARAQTAPSRRGPRGLRSAAAGRRRAAECRLRRTGPGGRPRRDPAARLALRHPQLRRRRAAPGRGGLPRHRAAPARPRQHALPVGHDDAQRPAGRGGAGHHRVDGRPADPQGRLRRVRLGRPHRRHHRGDVSRALRGTGVGQRLPDQQPRGDQGAAAARRPNTPGGISSTSRPSTAGPATRSTAATSPG